MDSAAGLTKWIFLCLCLSRCAYACRILEESRIYFLNADDSISSKGLKTYCHNATSKYLIWKIWSTMTMHLNINSDSYILYKGQTPDEIHQKYNKKNDQLWNLNKQFQINPFKNECLGVYVDSPNESGYIITLIETRIDVWRLTMMAMGIILFWCAKILRQDSLFYYPCGIIFGVPAIYLYNSYKSRRKFERQGKVICIILAAFMSFIAMHYREWLMLWILVTLLIGRTIYDHFGQSTNARMKKIIIQLFIQQLVGLVLVYYSSNFLEISFLLCFGLILFSKAAFLRGNRYW